MTSRWRSSIPTLLTLALCAGLPGDIPAQGTGKSKSKPKAGAVKALDVRVEKLETTMLREIMEIANLYEEAGQYERAKSLLDVLMKLNPQLPGLKERIEELERKTFDAQEIEFAFDVSKTWTPVGASAVKGRPVRIEVEGEYKFQYAESLTADGITSIERGQDLIENIPMGALMAVVVTNGKAGKAIPLGKSLVWTPTEDGLVTLKINAPAGHRCSGKLLVKLSGLVRTESP